MAYKYQMIDLDFLSKKLVWQKATPIEGLSPDEWRMDRCGHVIRFSDHGNTDSEYGWEIDHIQPIEENGPDTPENRQPLYWKTNRDKGDTYPWSCP